MTWKSNADRYGRVAVLIHWVSALAIFGLLGSGLYLEDLADDAQKTSVLRIHAIMGVMILLLTLLRIGWWVFADRRPAHLAGMPRWQAVSAAAVHGLLYVVMLAMAASGIAMIALSGAGDILFSGAPGPLPDFREYLPRAPHGIGGRLLMALIAAHVGAALYHQFVRRDGLMRRMGWLGSR
jgi:cytochrome b561